MSKNFKKIGENLKKLRIAKNLSLREICKKINYDASNWSKIERGIMPPPTNKKILSGWAKALGLKQDSKQYRQFLDEVQISQGIIPEDIFKKNNAVNYLPAVFRTLRNEKPTKQEIDHLIELIRSS